MKTITFCVWMVRFRLPAPKSGLIEGVRRFRLALFSFLANVLGNTWEDKLIVKLPGMSIHCLGKEGRGSQYLFHVEIFTLVGERKQMFTRCQDMTAISQNLGGTGGSRYIADNAGPPTEMKISTYYGL